MEKYHKAPKMPPEVENHTGMTVEAIKKSFWDNLKFRMVKEDQTATPYDLFLSLAYAIRDRLVENWVDTQRFYRTRKVRRVYYLSLEFLIGRTLGNSIINLQVEDNVAKALQDMGFSLEELRENEIDAGLGNGGLGRLAACFLDSLSTLGVPADGYGIRYDYGIFNQEIDANGCQVEKPDEWLNRTYPWEVFRSEYVHRVQFGGRVVQEPDAKTGKSVKKWVDTEDVIATAYDTPIPGYGNRTVNNLRLWSARATEQFHLDFFNRGNYFEATS